MRNWSKNMFWDRDVNQDCSKTFTSRFSGEKELYLIKKFENSLFSSTYNNKFKFHILSRTDIRPTSNREVSKPMHKALMSCLKDHIKLSERLIHPPVNRFNL